MASALLWFRCLSIVTDEDPQVNANLPQNLLWKGQQQEVWFGLVASWGKVSWLQTEDQSGGGPKAFIDEIWGATEMANEAGSEPVDQSSAFAPYFHVPLPTLILHMGNLRTFAL